ncbi:uncharacterized protein LOC114893756 [Monodon monoceros]|uniref:uncharacterized protein LOC114893756 n=1 Tax=Monodon monoceros TaxID=40151 RepID=UPI0010F4F9F6|nr:uncharacterized protein LOC114893756 [Monodon monoceros]
MFERQLGSLTTGTRGTDAAKKHASPGGFTLCPWPRQSRVASSGHSGDTGGGAPAAPAPWTPPGPALEPGCVVTAFLLSSVLGAVSSGVPPLKPRNDSVWYP